MQVLKHAPASVWKDTARVIDESGIAADLEAKLEQPVGRPRDLPIRTLLTALLVLARMGHALELRGVHHLLATMPDKAKELVPPHRNYPTVEMPPSERAICRLMHAIEVAYQVSAHRPTGRKLTDDERQANEATLWRLLDRLVAASLPADRAWEHVAVDATNAPAAVTKVDTKAITERCSDPDVGYVIRDGQPPVIGYEAHFLVPYTRRGDVRTHPQVIDRFRLVRGAANPAPVAVDLVTAALDDGRPVKTLVADRGYSHKAATTFLWPLKHKGVDAVFDLHEADRGRWGKSDSGAVIIDGWFYSPSMPRALHDIGKYPFRAKNGKPNADYATFKDKVAQRAAYALKVHTKTDADGYTRLTCQAARGLVRCANKQPSMSGRRTLPLMTTPPAPPLPDICAKKTVKVLPQEGGKTRQTFIWGSDAWEAHYGPGRAAVESVNRQIKDSGKEHAGTPGRIKLRGRTRYSFLYSFYVMSHNLRVTDSWNTKAETSPRPASGAGPQRRKPRRTNTLVELIEAPAIQPAEPSPG